MTYKAIVTPIRGIRDHLNADKLNIGKVCNCDIIIGKDIEEGQLGVYFPDDGQLSHEFCYNNNLYKHNQYNIDPEAKSGFFDDNRRVTAIKLRGEKSEGFWCPIEQFTFTGYNISKLKEGFEFDTLNGVPICNKYITKATKEAIAKNNKQNPPNKKKMALKEKYPHFKEHWDTKQLAHYVNKIPKGALLQISEKCHGSSGRTGILKQYYYLSTFKKWWNNNFPIKFKEYNYRPISGSRRVILDNGIDNGYYSGTIFREEAHNKIIPMLNTGETVYYELVGYTGKNGKAIMGAQGIKDKELKKLYGDRMEYSYGCAPNHPILPPYEIYVYRITRTLDNGSISEMPYYQMVARCKEMGLKIVPEFKSQFIYDGDADKLLKLCEELSEGPSTLDPKHIREGVVVRVDYPGIETNFKYKSISFKVLEGTQKGDKNFIDTEESS